MYWGKKYHLLLSLLLVIVFLLQYTNSTGNNYKMKEGQKRLRIPFESYNNLIIITLTINNSIPLKFILDTGVNTTTLFEKSLSQILGLKYSDTINLPVIGANKFITAFLQCAVRIFQPASNGSDIRMPV